MTRNLMRVRLHVDTSRGMAPVFRIEEPLYLEALRGFPDLAKVLKTTIGHDLEGFEEALSESDALVAWKFPRDNLRVRAPHLKWIHIIGAGAEHLMPLDWLPRGVVLTNNRGVHAPKAAEYATMALLMLNCQIPALVTSQRHRTWDRRFSTTLAGKTLLIVGVGNMGGAAARSGRRLGLRILGVRRTARPHRAVHEMYGPEHLSQLLPKADFVLVATPLTGDTRQLIGRPEFDRMKTGAGFINIGRAGVVDYTALSDKLQTGEISGAVLDVFDPEPLPTNSPLWDVPNLIITPHVSSDDAARYAARTLDLVLQNVRRLAENRPLLNPVQRVRQY
jgi:phosphoglycerate dehydrogenase-like enzyme